jgi:serine/threonine protein kinase
MEITIQPGQIVENRYRFEHPIGFGAYGSVWKAWHETLSKPLAIKVIEIHNLDPTNLERVKNECKIGGQLGDGSGIVQVWDAFEEREQLFIVMELMEGGSLQKVFQQKLPQFPVALSWAIELSDALGGVHAHGVIHRDIKPQNILLSANGHPKLSDFGVAHLPKADITSYQPGTPGYKAPELDAGLPVTPAADIYSLSAVFFELFSGRQYSQYKGQPDEVIKDEFVACLKQEHSEVPDNIGRDLVHLILNGLEKDPAQRVSLTDLHARLRDIRAGWQTPQKVIDQAQESLADQIRPKLKGATFISRLVQVPQPSKSAARDETALVNWLADKFGEWFLEHSDKELILWYDPYQDWSPLLTYLEPHLNMIVDEGSLLKARYQIEEREPGLPLVVYIPRSREEVAYLEPFTFTSLVFDQRLYDFLLENEVLLPTYGDERKALQALMPALVPTSIGKGYHFWHQIKSLKDAENLLIPDFRERLFQFMAQPAAVLNDLEADGLDIVFKNLAHRKYGFSDNSQPPDEYAQRLFAHWVFAELYTQAGRPDNYPFQNALPAAVLFAECRNDLSALRHDSRYQDTYLSYAKHTEQQYPTLITWTKQHLNKLTDPPLPEIAKQVWGDMWEEIQKWGQRTQVLAELEARRSLIRSLQDSFWTKIGVVPGWKVLHFADEVIQAAAKAVEQSGTFTSPDDFIRAYISTWWIIDRMYRHYHTAIVDAMISFEELTRWVILFYDEFSDQSSLRWSETLNASEYWPPQAEIPIVDEASERIWGGSNHTAIFMVDALRYELAVELKETLRGENVQQDAWIAVLPSVTATGMAALIPQAKARQVTWEDGWKINLPDFEKNLATSSGREAWIKQKYPKANVLALHKWLNPNMRISVSEQPLVIVGSELDAWGENASELSLGAFNDLIGKVAQGIRKALDSGFESVHVVTDHGFILLGHVTESGKIQTNIDNALKIGHRYLIGRGPLEQEGVLRFSITGSQDLIGWFPPGTACFKSAGSYNYAHGGITLQEVIIPHLQIQKDKTSVPVGVRVLVADKVYSGVFKITLEPLPKGFFVKDREVWVILQRTSGDVIREMQEIVNVGEAVTKNIKLTINDNISFGETLFLVVRDANSGEELDKKSVEIHVDLEL